MESTGFKAGVEVMLAACRRAEMRNQVRFNGERGFSIFVSRKRRYDHAKATARRRAEWNDPTQELSFRAQKWADFVASARQALPTSVSDGAVRALYANH